MGHTDLASSSANENRLRVHNCRGYLLIFIKIENEWQKKPRFLTQKEKRSLLVPTAAFDTTDKIWNPLVAFPHQHACGTLLHGSTSTLGSGFAISYGKVTGTYVNHLPLVFKDLSSLLRSIEQRTHEFSFREFFLCL